MNMNDRFMRLTIILALMEVGWIVGYLILGGSATVFWVGFAVFAAAMLINFFFNGRGPRV